MTNKVVWTFLHNGDNSPDRKTFINGHIVHLLDDGLLYNPQKDVYSQYQYQTIDDVNVYQLQKFITLLNKN